MAKYTIGGIVLLFFLFLCIRFLAQQTESLVSPQVIHSPNTTPTSPSIGDEMKDTTSLFVPYWTVDNELPSSSYDTTLYFGISADETGIDTSDPGYKNIDLFIEASKASPQRFLTIRMLEKTFNADLLENTVLQEKIIDQSIAEAKKHGFTGIVLDYELAALSFDSVIKKISAFYQRYSHSVRSEQLSFGITVYGDVFYRMRPYDVKTLEKDADTLYIMAYDFHKARENPGPNFPLAGKSTYGYDMEMMATDFLAVVPAQKLVVVFGMFGYDWIVDRRGTSVENATPLSWLKAKKQFISSCHFKNCTVERSPLSAETTVTYTDEDRRNHIVWFEDMESVAAKKKYLQSRGITNFGYWAYSYF